MNIPPPLILFRNSSINTKDVIEIKRQSDVHAPTDELARALELHDLYKGPVKPEQAFETMFPGASVYAYNNLWTKELGTNNASLIVFLDIGGYKICLPGDLEADGWEMLLKEEGFVEHLESSSILIAPHHGRSNGYCERVMKNCRFHLVIVESDPISLDTELA